MIHLVETLNIQSNEYEKKDFLNESDQTIQMIEGKEVKTYKSKAIYTFPISRPNQENLNGRIYSNRLWERAIKNLQDSSTFGLMDHPKDEASTKDIWCVWRNLRFNESKNLVVADAYLVGKNGDQVLEILEAGGQIGLSTSGFGEMKEDKKTVDPESYSLERVADFVFNPSYQVFGNQSNKVEQKEDVKESNLKEDKVNLKEKKMEEKMKEKDYIAKSVRSNMALSFKQAMKEENLEKRAENLEEILSCFDEEIAEDLYKNIKDELVKTEESIKTKAENEVQEEIAKLKEELENLTKEKESILEKLENSIQILDSTKVYSKKLKEMYDIVIAEKNGMVNATEYREAVVYSDKLEEDNKKLEEKVLDLQDMLKQEKSKTSSYKMKERHERQESRRQQTAIEKKEEKEENEFEGIKEEIVKYYKDKERANPNMIKIKEEILRCRTLLEAQTTYLRLKSLIEEDYSPYDRYNTVKLENTENKSKKFSKIASRKGWV